MRSRNVVSHTFDDHDHDIDLKNISSSDEEAIKSRGFEVDDDELKKTNIIMIQNPRIILCLGILLGVLLSIFIHHIDTKPIQNVHKSVKNAYRAHNEARKEYLKRYREAYLESILSSSANVVSKEEEERNTSNNEVISTATAADIEVDNTITEQEESKSTATFSYTSVEGKPCSGKYCWGKGLSITELVDAQLARWINKGGITPKDVEQTEGTHNIFTVDTNGDVLVVSGDHHPESGAMRQAEDYIRRAMQAYPNLYPETKIVLGRCCRGQDYPIYPVRESSEEEGLPLVISGAGYEEFLDILLPYVGHSMWDSRYEALHANLLTQGEGNWLSRKNEVVWRGALGCNVGCGKRGDLYFPSNHIEHCSDDQHNWDADGNGRTGGCEKSVAGKYHQRIQLVNISLNHPECVDARITSLNDHRDALRGYLTDSEITALRGSFISEEHLADYRYVVNVQNNAFADRLWRHLALGNVVFQEKWFFQEFFYDMLLPWVHFIPIKTDLSDLCEKVAWAKENEEKSRVISENGRSFVRDKLRLEDVNLYVATLIHRIGELTILGHKDIVV